MPWQQEDLAELCPKSFRPTNETGYNVYPVGTHVLNGNFMMPLALLHEDALQHNARIMSRFCTEHGVSLAPHAKTTMSPQLLRLQLAHGAWGMTVATVSQLLTLHSFGIRRVLIANEVADETSLRCLRQLCTVDPTFEVFCLVDSVELVERMDVVLAEGAFDGRLSVLVEIGPPGGRCGCRTDLAAHEVANAVAGSKRLGVAGIEAYEGVLTTADPRRDADEVDRFFEWVTSLVEDMRGCGVFAGREEVIVSAGASMFFDRAVEKFTDRLSSISGMRMVLRCGSYLTFESGAHAHRSPFATGAVEQQFRPAIEVWATVLSVPDPGRAILGAGKRDLPYDIELPFPTKLRRDGRTIRPAPESYRIVALNDQHAMIESPDLDLRVGDLVGMEIAHPCGIFEKWRMLPIVSDYVVKGYAQTALL